MRDTLRHSHDRGRAGQRDRDGQARPHRVLSEAHGADSENLSEHERRRAYGRDDDLDDPVVLLLEDAPHDVGAVDEDRHVDEEEEYGRHRDVEAHVFAAFAALDVLRFVRVEIHAHARGLVDFRVDAPVLQALFRGRA